MASEIECYLVSPDAVRQTESAEGALLEVGGTVDGLRVMAYLGRGSASEVWRVRDAALGRDLALKLFASAGDSIARERFLAEARLLAQFSDAHLVRVHAFGEKDGRPYFTMDLLHPLPENPSMREVRKILGDVLDGLDFLHSHGVIHRDVTPSNVLLDDAGHAVLTDLGIAHVGNVELSARVQSAAAHNLTLADGRASALGTPGFGAPEQFAGGEVSPATDIHAVGAFLVALFGGRPPLAWRGLIRRMTSSSVELRPRTVREVRAHLRRMALLRVLSAVAAAVSASLVLWSAVAVFRTEWRELPPAYVQRFADRPEVEIRLPGPGHFVLPSLVLSPVLSPEAEQIGPDLRTNPDGTVDIGYPLEILRDDSAWRRRTVAIRGRGTLKCPVIVAAEVHLSSGVTLVTSGMYEPDGDLIKSETPPACASFTNAVGYAAYVVEPGAKLVFTENADYPRALIEMRK